MSDEWAKALSNVWALIEKGWRLTLPIAVTAGIILFAPDSWLRLLPYAREARTAAGVVLLPTFLVCGIHVAVLGFEGAAKRVGKAAGRWREKSKLERLSDEQRLVLAAVVRGEGYVYLPTGNTAVRGLLAAGIVQHIGESDEDGNVGVRVEWSFLQWLRQYPGLLDVPKKKN
jgi:hypothetical protein